MSLLYPEEHLLCYNYENGEKPAVEIINIQKGDTREYPLAESAIAFILKGRLRMSLGDSSSKEVSEGRIVLLPFGDNCIAVAEEDATVVCFRIGGKLQLCDRFPIEQLCGYAGELNPESDFNPLIMNDRMKEYISNLYTCINSGLKCYHFLELKIKELFFLLRGYYSKTELAMFFYPVLGKDLNFSEYVLNNHHKVKTVQELASLSCYSLSAFNKRFKSAFGVSPYRWMKMQKAKRIYHEISGTQKTFSDISESYAFSSLSQFSDFCKANFGFPPGKIRKNDPPIKLKVEKYQNCEKSDGFQEPL